MSGKKAELLMAGVSRTKGIELCYRYSKMITGNAGAENEKR